MSARRTCLGLVAVAVVLSCLPGDASAQLFRRRAISSTFAPRGPSNPCGNLACRMCYPAGSASVSVCTTGNCQVSPILDQVVRDVEDDIPTVPTARKPALPSADPTGPLAPTPPDVVELMLAVAGVTEDDVVYDLGCGDGRLLKAAAEHGARCVGFELDADRAIAAIDNCRGLDVTICYGDSRDADWTEATVFVVYMTPEFMAEVAPQMSYARLVVSYCHEVPGMANRAIKFRGHVVYLATPTTQVAQDDWSMVK